MESPTTYIPMDRRQAIINKSELADRDKGTALFSDISGFTTMTETLLDLLGPQRGVEELTRQLNLVYEALTGEVNRYGGSVISFAGDALTCWFSGDDGKLATGCALAMQKRMTQFSAFTPATGVMASLSLKVAVAGGPVRRLLVGNPEIQLLDVLAGETIDRLARGEHLAARGEVILDQVTITNLGQDVTVREWRVDTKTGESYGLIDGLNREIASRPWTLQDGEELNDDLVRPWLLPPIFERLRSTQGELLAELRPAVALFMQFGGINYDEDEAAGEKLQIFTHWVQSVLSRYEGFLLQLIFGDKGSYLYAAFGAPVAHDDDTIRAVAAARELSVVPTNMGFIKGVRIGLSRGIMRAGAYGGSARHTYGVLGDDVNVAARLMEHAQTGQILVSGRIVYQLAQHYDVQTLGEMEVKGKQTTIPVFLIRGESAQTEQRTASFYAQRLVGRQNELALLENGLSKAQTGKGDIISVEGAPGMGKSRIAAELIQQAQNRGIHVALGICHSTTQYTPYAPWRQIFLTLFDFPDTTEENNHGRQISLLQNLLASFKHDAMMRFPLLGDLLALPIPDNQLTASLEPKSRREALFSLVIELIRYRAGQKPLLFVVDDAHWLDEASSDLIAAMARAMANNAITLAIFQRPPQHDNSLAAKLSNLPYYHQLELQELPNEGLAELIADRLGGISAPLTMAIIQLRAQGNPFFAEEIIDTFREENRLVRNAEGNWELASTIIEALQAANCLVKDTEGEWQLLPDSTLTGVDMGLPDSIYGIVLSRLDRLPEAPKLTIKVASVIGRTFNLAVLASIHPLHHSPPLLEKQLAVMQTRDLIRLDSPLPQVNYLFKHNITHEVAYGTLLFDQRRQLHEGIAKWYESGRPVRENISIPTTLQSKQTQHFLDQEIMQSVLPGDYPLLAYHWQRAENREKECYYAELSGIQAAARFANEDALTYFSRAMSLTAESDLIMQYRVLLAREAVYYLCGRREEEVEDLAALKNLVAKTNDEHARANVALREGRYYEVVSEYPKGLEATQYAVKLAVQLDDTLLEVSAYLQLGKLFSLQSDYEGARELLERALRLAQERYYIQNEAEILIELGLVLREQGKYTAAQENIQKAWLIYQSLGHVTGEAKASNALGMLFYGLSNYKNAGDQYEKALSISEMTGNRIDEARSLNNLGLIWSAQGDYFKARQYFERALAINRETGSVADQAVNLNNLGMVCGNLGDFPTTRLYMEQALEITRIIGDRRIEAISLLNLGEVCLSLGDFSMAIDYYAQALNINRQIGNRARETASLTYLASVYLEAGDYKQAGIHHTEALALARQLGNRRLEALNLGGLARVNFYTGEYRQALALVENGLSIATEIGDKRIEATNLTYAGHTKVKLGEIDNAHTCYNTAANIRREINEPHKVIDDLVGLVEITENESARALVDEILQWLAEHGPDGIEEPLKAYLVCYQLLEKIDRERAEKVLETAYQLLEKRSALLGNDDMRWKFRNEIAVNKEIFLIRHDIFPRPPEEVENSK